MDTMLQAIRTMRPALEAFYATLSDEQKARLNSNPAVAGSGAGAITGSAGRGTAPVSGQARFLDLTQRPQAMLRYGSTNGRAPAPHE